MIVENDGTEMIWVLLKCPDPFVWENLSKILSTCLNRLF